MKLPNGYGTVVKLKGNRRRPYAVRRTAGYNETGHPIQIPIGYASTREEALAMLAAYNREPWDVDKAKITLAELFELWREKKAPKLGTSNRGGLRSAYGYCLKYADKRYRDIKRYHMQECIDECGKSCSTQGTIKNLWRHLDDFAAELEIPTGHHALGLKSASIPPTTRDRFSDAELKKLWEHRSEPWIDTVLILVYSGWRISEFLNIKTADVNPDEGTVKGGLKTEAGKNRIVPIHSLIFDMVKRRLEDGGEYLICLQGEKLSANKYRSDFWRPIMERLGMKKVPHECRHTFESLLDSAGANRRCIDLMMGHVSKDTGNRVYNHKTLEELKLNIELITR